MMQGFPSHILGLPLEIAVFLGIVLLTLAAAVLLSSSPRGRMRKQAQKMQRRVQNKAAYQTEQEARNTSLRRAEGDSSLPLLTRLLGQRRIADAVRARLARAGLSLTAERYIVYNGMLFAFTFLGLLGLTGGSASLSFLLAIVAGLGLPHMVVNFLIGRRIKAFLVLFPDAIDLIVRGLRAGLPVTESIKMVAREIGEPVNQVFQLMTEKMALGVPLEKTLYETAAKYRITEFDFFVTSIVLQRETGGNLSEILNNLSEALRQRLMMRLKIKAMSSEARASMYIIGALPFLVLLALRMTSPEYLDPLFDDYRGNIAAFVAIGMLGTGIFTMMRMAKFEI